MSSCTFIKAKCELQGTQFGMPISRREAAKSRFLWFRTEAGPSYPRLPFSFFWSGVGDPSAEESEAAYLHALEPHAHFEQTEFRH
jgi:hypothetical protein